MIRILIDSTADYTLEEIKAKNMIMVPLSVTFGDETFRDIEELSAETFYERLVNDSNHPKTALPSPGDFLEKFEEAKEAGDELICIMLSSGISGTYQSAVNAKAMADYEGIYVVDSLTTAAAIRILVEHAEKRIAEGASAAEIVAELEEIKERTQIYAAVDTLEYLYKGGRLSKAAATIGSMASLKVVIELDKEGKVNVAGKCLGKAKTMNFIVDSLKKHPQDKNHNAYMIYSKGTENAEKLGELLVKAGYEAPAITRIGSTIGTHIGPGAYGIIYVKEK